jgi:hypothetical protein
LELQLADAGRDAPQRRLFRPDRDPYWTVTIQAPVQSPFGDGAEEAEAGGPAWAQQTEASLKADGFDPTATALPWPNYADDPRGLMGVRVRVGEFATQGGTLPAGDSAVQAIGADAAWLSAHAQLGQQLGVSEQLRTASGAPFPLNPQMSIATADGIPGVSAGLTLTEEAELLRSLGAADAMNLDGGGSTQFASEGQLLNDASSSPLRPVGDTIQVVP